ncbi:hypothetical protein MTR67_017951 [Solanum verrucosum]|uniref:Uncharacterized protein n=1 Tax=Solanum verrucosum TaxID=315347 RepID=A0AAF0QPW9_SOLVR|nr:hypothetical protein MTR67_017951 [Solanum verrucosum]
MIERQFNIKVKMIRFDNALELGGSNLSSEFFASQGIIHQTSCTHTPQTLEPLPQFRFPFTLIARSPFTLPAIQFFTKEPNTTLSSFNSRQVGDRFTPLQLEGDVGIEIKKVSEEEKEAKKAQVLTTGKLLNQTKFRDNIESISQLVQMQNFQPKVNVSAQQQMKAQNSILDSLI